MSSNRYGSGKASAPFGATAPVEPNPMPLIRNQLPSPTTSGALHGIPRVAQNGGGINTLALVPPYGVERKNFDPFSKSQGFSPYTTSDVGLQQRDYSVEVPETTIITAVPFKNDSHRALITDEMIFSMPYSEGNKVGKQVCVTLAVLNMALRVGYSSSIGTFNDVIKQQKEYSDVVCVPEDVMFSGAIYDKILKEYENSEYTVRKKNGMDGGEDGSKVLGYRITAIHENRTHRALMDMERKDLKNNGELLKMTLNKEYRTTTNEATERDLNAFAFSITRNVRRSTESTKVWNDRFGKSMRFWQERTSPLEKDNMRYMYGPTIRAQWEFRGAIRSSTVNDLMNSGTRNQWGYTREGPYDITVTVKKKGRLFNYWGNDLRIGDLLWLILTRRRDSITGEWAEFHWLPWSDRRHSPPDSVLQYVDKGGVSQLGYVQFVGEVNEKPRKLCPDDIRLAAAGLLPDVQTWQKCHENVLKLEPITIQLRLRN